MSLRRAAVPAIVLALLGSMVPAAEAIPSADRTVAKELPRPERSRAVKDRTYEPHTVLVKFKTGTSAAAKERALKSRGGRSAVAIPGTGFVKVTSKGAAADFARELRRDPTVKGVSLDYRRTASAIPNDPAFSSGQQGYLRTIRLPEAWDRTKGSTSQVIAVVDSGVDSRHTELTGRILAGYDAINNVLIQADGATDDNGHGTMISGVVAAKTNNGIGVAGVVWSGGRVMPVKVLDAYGNGWDSDVAEGVTWAADHGAKVINLSLGGPADNPVLREAITSATGKGAVVVAAAGNEGDGTPQYPAAYPEVLSVAATDTAGRLTDFSSHGDWIDVAAPGYGIVAPGLWQEYYTGTGTSFAAPMVSGVAALVRSVSPTLTPAQVIARIKGSARDAGPRGIDPYYGKGVIDAFAAVGGARGADFPSPVLGTMEPNNVPASATRMTASISGAIAIEGDVDWYRYESAEKKGVSIAVKPQGVDIDSPQNLDPVLAVYDRNLRLVGEADEGDRGLGESLKLNLGVGTYYVKVTNWNGAADPRPYTVSVAAALPTLFDPAVVRPAGSRPERVTVGDVTGDGRDDVLVTDSGSGEAKLMLFRQQPDGSLGSPLTYATQTTIARGSIAILDVDGDGRRDVALTSSAGVEVFRQVAGGTLLASEPIPGTAGANKLVAADMNGDRVIDLVTGGTAGIGVLLRAAGGGFVPSVVTVDPLDVDDVEVGDVNGDGRIDIASYAGTAVRVFRQTATGWAGTDHPTGSSWSGYGLDIADVSGDGRADIVVTEDGPYPTIVTMTQNAGGGLDAPVSHPAGRSPGPVESADVDGDSRTDVVVGHAGAVSVFRQKADGTLGTPVTKLTPNTHIPAARDGLALGDVNGDKLVDVVFAEHYTGLVVLGNASGPTPGGEQVWVRGMTPGDNTWGQAPDIAPKVTFQRALAPASVTASTVRLVNGKTGATVAATVAYDSVTRAVTIKPTTSLPVNTPFRIVVKGVRDTSGATQAEAFTSTFRTGWYRITARLPR